MLLNVPLCIFNFTDFIEIIHNYLYDSPMKANNNGPTSRQIYVTPDLHDELKAYAEFEGKFIKTVVGTFLRKALDDVGRGSYDTN